MQCKLQLLCDIIIIHSTYLTEYLGGGKSESGESEGSIIGTGEQEAETSGESGPSVAELWSEVTGSGSGNCPAVSESSTRDSFIFTTPPAPRR